MRAASFWRRWSTAAAALSVLMWFALPVDVDQPLVGARQRDEWTLADLPGWQVTPATSVLVAGASFWGQQATAIQAAPVVDTRWRLAGVVGAEGARRVLVSFSDTATPSVMLSRGDKLPSGHRITKIGERDICVELNKRSYTLPLERLDLKE